MSPAALHLKWPLGHVGEEEAHIAVPLRLPLGPRCRLREDWGQVPMSCSVVGSGSGPPLAVWQHAGMFGRSASSSPSVQVPSVSRCGF